MTCDVGAAYVWGIRVDMGYFTAPWDVDVMVHAGIWTHLEANMHELVPWC